MFSLLFVFLILLLLNYLLCCLFFSFLYILFHCLFLFFCVICCFHCFLYCWCFHCCLHCWCCSAIRIIIDFTPLFAISPISFSANMCAISIYFCWTPISSIRVIYGSATISQFSWLQWFLTFVTNYRHGLRTHILVLWESGLD